ncbi:MAG: single-stranded DNA-binding protein [Verrucomicrobia bacterium]|nr:single-stranded DNA-binding protein [Verrucomicrobiota bacterium]MBU4246797.1 single-stranded DNA-binding protein [Verrucomicrobiota bacterium]MBU4290569.1 single-stranded DNA-binding protein [Verrucomicrobiota bacterium]MBU4496593.1 single-stranded DNA-binding protein [Verrucomicrobiota bacterium]MCG2681215.1 single-stranded DNA-binding protein [Kiritimatiellia bacterium]
MANLNRVFLAGNLTRDPEVRYIPSGKAVADLQLAINRKYKTATGETKEDTCFVGVVVWGRQAETSGEYLKKGSSVLIEGSLRYEKWESNGEKRSRHVVVADRVQFLDRIKRSADGAPPAAAAEPAHREEAPPLAAGEEEPPADGKTDADDLPF